MHKLVWYIKNMVDMKEYGKEIKFTLNLLGFRVSSRLASIALKVGLQLNCYISLNKLKLYFY